jgi:cell division protein FtsI/penicillin-binding protein 2
MREPQDPRDWRRSMATRIGVVGAGFALCVLALLVKLVYLQVFCHDDYLAERKAQVEKVQPVPARRGEILDRNRKLLAKSVDAGTIKVSRSQVDDPVATAARICGALRDCDAPKQARLTKLISGHKDYVELPWELNPDQAARITALKDEALTVAYIGKARRWYPYSELAAQVLGYVNEDNEGLAGVENTFNRELSGTPGQALVFKDGLQGEFTRIDLGATPVPGKTLELTIDANLQHLAERALRDGVLENKAAGGALLVLDPMTGEILAMASYPTYNANLFTRASDEARKNRPVQHTYEPGSTFKIVTVSAAIQNHVFRPDDMIDTNPGRVYLKGRMVDEYQGHNYGVISFTDVIVKSSNVGAIKIGWSIGASALRNFVEAFGFGTRLSRDFRSEERGFMGSRSSWGLDTVMSASMGYAVNVTALQMASAASVIANGGELLEPHIIHAWIEGNQRSIVPPKVIRRVISPETAATVRTMMEGVAERGTAKVALTSLLQDYSVAGKTGTSNKNVGGHYIDQYNTSFVGFVPSRQPALTILVHIDSPNGPKAKAGGAVAAPIFQRFADEALRYLAIPPTVNPPSPVLVAANAATARPAAIPVAASGNGLTIVPASGLAPGQVVLPDLHGLSGREALRVLMRLGIRPRMTGDGVVTQQEPAAGTPVETGTACRLELRRTLQGIQP